MTRGAIIVLGWVAAAALALPALAAGASLPRPNGDLLYANGFEYATRYAGGVNYLWYGLGTVADPCAREGWNVLKNYAAPGVRATAQQQLATMHARGMDSLSLGVYFGHGITSGSIIDSSDPVAVSALAAHLANLLADVDAAGFGRVLFRFFPQGAISPSNPAHGFSGNNDPLLDEYWNLIASLRPVLVASGIDYRIDLMVEGEPRDDDSFACKNWGDCDPHDSDWSNAVRELWRRYQTTYGTADTVGFSFIGTTSSARARVRHMDYVYQGVYPDTFAFTFYGDADDSRDEADQFVNYVNLMDDYGAQYGFSNPHWIIAEAYHDDAYAAARLASAIAASGQAVDYLTEWPLSRDRTCTDVDTPPPYGFDFWRAAGF